MQLSESSISRLIHSLPSVAPTNARRPHRLLEWTHHLLRVEGEPLVIREIMREVGRVVMGGV